MATVKSRKNRAPLNLAMGLVGLLSVFTIIAAELLALPKAIVPICAAAMIISLAVMFFTRRSDEYTLALWSAGTNAAFAAIIGWLIIGPFAAGVMEGFNAAHEGREAERNFSYAAGSGFSIIAFYVVFNIKRLTGAL
ncbi:hypothetical protein [Aurantiacibacter marinus]|uniref:Uncharacterized protein n=1 Tax=Aurantiacibacter marinus TaxID=874156 RepID=A0A0H0XNK1_9SPHN|nr:hypothetical protein [Aurantiacibacter marinus]KLI63909.1 hypothetical protein AAV99_09450 [Aurantiacibacter marinus]